jgi:two-component system, NarL family, sensor histidine kinase UhpB
MDQRFWRILLIDDDEDDYLIVRDMLSEARREKFALEWSRSYTAGSEALQSKMYDAVLVDYSMGMHNGNEIVREAVASGYPAPFILLTGQGNYEVDIEAMEAGASDYLNKAEINTSLLERAIRYAIERKKNEIQLRRSEEDLRESKERFQRALENTPDVVVLYDRDLRIQYINGAVHTVSGRPVTDFLGKREDEIWPPEIYEMYLPTLENALQTGKTQSVETDLCLTDGVVRSLAITCVPLLDENGSVREMLGIAHDYTERKQAEEKIRNMEVQRKLLEYREKERQDIARDLHDGPVQDLSGLIFNIQFTKEAIKDPALQVELEQISLALKSTVHELRSMINELRPPSLIRFGFSKAMQFHIDDFREKHPEIQIHANLMEDEDSLPEPVRLTLYRIMQEGLNNIARHARASQVSIDFRCFQDETTLHIQDNGNGFALSNNLGDYTIHGHFGLVGMRERAESVGGHLAVQSVPGQGTEILVTIPIEKTE